MSKYIDVHEPGISYDRVRSEVNVQADQHACKEKLNRSSYFYPTALGSSTTAGWPLLKPELCRADGREEGPACLCFQRSLRDLE